MSDDKRKAKILLLDIETAPNTAHVWGLFKQNIAINQIQESSYVLCWAAKWLGEDVCYFSSVHEHGRKNMLKEIHKMLDEADAVIHYNGTRFDIPTLNKEFLKDRMLPPSPHKDIDLLRASRGKFRLTSNKLDYVASFLGVGKKHAHHGHKLWTDCMNNDPEAWKIMEEYNIQDVWLLEEVYPIYLPWIKNHLNLSLIEGSKVCPNCASFSFQKRGFMYTSAGKYQKYSCNSCGTWFKSGSTMASSIKDRTQAI